MSPAETADLSLKVLQRIQEDISSMRTEFRGGIAELKKNTEGIPEMVRDIHELLGKTGRAREDIDDLKQRVSALEARAR